MEWISNNVGALISAVILVFGLVATWVLYGADIKQLKIDKNELKLNLAELEKVVSIHKSDTSLHIDPHRDEKRWDDFKAEIMRRFDGMEGKIEKIMVITPPPPMRS